MADPQSSLPSIPSKTQGVLKHFPVALEDGNSDALEHGAGLRTVQHITKSTSLPLLSLQGRDQQAHCPG